MAKNYGHFHQSWNSEIEGILFSMLDIMEFKEICILSTILSLTFCYYLQKWNTLTDFEAALDDYIEYYNNERIKLRLVRCFMSYFPMLVFIVVSPS